MRIDLHPGQDCTVLEVIGNLHESKTIVPGQTHLVLAKIRIGKVDSRAGESNQSSEGMIAQLQDHLGDTISSYLTVRLTYKHSGYPNHKPIHVDGMRLRMTRIETEATATIKRRNPDSAWSPRASRTTSNPINLSPLVILIEQHLTPEQAVEVKKRLIDDRSMLSVARKLGRWSDTSHDYSGGSSDAGETDGIDALLSRRVSVTRGQDKPLVDLSPIPANSTSNPTTTDDSFEDIDPARKIWTQMKMTSKGARHGMARASFDASHHSSTPDISSNTPNKVDGSPSRRQKSKSTGTDDVNNITFERGRIFDEALRNKRSVGTETLRSIAPSVTKTTVEKEKSKKGSTSGVGLGVSRG